MTHIAFLTMIFIVEWGKEFKIGWSTGTSTVTGGGRKVALNLSIFKNLRKSWHIFCLGFNAFIGRVTFRFFLIPEF